MTGAELARTLEILQPHGPTHLDHLMRSLRAGGLLPLGGRGASAPDLTPHEAANMLLGLATADKPTDGAAMAATYAALRPSWTGNTATGRPDQPRAFAKASTLGDALAAILGNMELALEVEELQVFQNWPRAVIRTKDPQRCGFYGYASHEEAKAAGYRTTPSGPRFHFSASTLQAIAIEIAEDNG